MNILVIKLGASGDVVRTLPIAQAIKKKYPNSQITWITKEHNMQILEKNPHIEKIFSVKNYPKEFFDVLYNFDVEEEATKIAIETNAGKKYGFYSEAGYPLAFNPSAEYYINTLFDDDLKRTNKKTYQQMMFEAAELPYQKEPSTIILTEKEKAYAEKFARDNNIRQEKLIGIYAGSSPKWPSKVWNFENIKEFIRKINQKNFGILLLGGPDEKGKYEEIINELEKEGIKIYTHDLNCSIRELISLINLCDKNVCPDSLSLHISLALKKPTIGLFFCTSPDEIEDYGILKKIVSPKLYDFFPLKQDQYSEELTKSISVDEVLNVLENNSSRVVNAIIKHPEEKKFLVIKRKEGLHAGKWAFPGGIVETNESDEQALARELKEETGLELKKIVKKVSEYSYLRLDNSKTQGVCFLIEVNNFDVRVNNSEVQEIKWVTIEEFENLEHIEGLEQEILSIISD